MMKNRNSVTICTRFVAHVIIVSTPVQRIGILFFLDLVLTYGQDLGPFGTGDWGLGLGLDN